MYKTRVLPPLPAKVSGSAADWPAQGRVKAVMRVLRDGHLPDRVALRSRIDAQLFTCDFEVGDLQHIAADPLVASIAASDVVQAIDAKPPAAPGARSGD